MLKLVIADDEGKKTVVPLVRDEITIGRKEGNTIRLTERNVSRRHARIVKRAQDYVLEDLASYNGIVVNNARLLEAKPVRTGDEIRIGDYTLSIVDEPGAQVSPTPPAPPVPSEPIVPLLSAPAPADPVYRASAASGRAAMDAATQSVPEAIRALRIVFLAPAGVPPPVMLDRLPMVMGRSEAADVALPFSSISREHAKVFVEDGRLMIEDMGSSNGVQVNGEKIRRGPLAPGDMVQLGVVEFRVARRGDSTVVIQQAALEERKRARRLPMGLVGGIIGGGLALGLGVVVAFNRVGTTPRPEVTTPQLVNAAPATTPTGEPTNPTSATPENSVAVQPETPPPTQPETSPTPETPPASETSSAPAQTAPENPPTPSPVGAPPTAAAPVGQRLLTAQERRAQEREAQRQAQREAQRQAAATAAAAARTRPPPTTPTTPPATRTTPSTPSASTPTGAATQPAGAASNEGLSPMQRVSQCRSSGGSEPERNNCIINALRNRASTQQELGVLATTLNAENRTVEAQRAMRTYLTRYPNGPLAPQFLRAVQQ